MFNYRHPDPLARVKVGPNSSCCHHFVGRIPGHVGQIPGHIGQIPETQIDDFLKEFDGFQRKSMDSLWNSTVGCVGQIPGHVGQIPATKIDEFLKEFDGFR